MLMLRLVCLHFENNSLLFDCFDVGLSNPLKGMSPHCFYLYAKRVIMKQTHILCGLLFTHDN